MMPNTSATDPADHLTWARGVARQVRDDFGFLKRSQEEQDLEQVAYLTLLRKCAQFDASLVPAGGDPVRAFQGYCHEAVASECRREARRLRNGGTYHTRRESRRPALVVDRLAARLTPSGELVEYPDPKSLTTHDDPDGPPAPEPLYDLSCE